MLTDKNTSISKLIENKNVIVSIDRVRIERDWIYHSTQIGHNITCQLMTEKYQKDIQKSSENDLLWSWKKMKKVKIRKQ